MIIDHIPCTGTSLFGRFNRVSTSSPDPNDILRCPETRRSVYVCSRKCQQYVYVMKWQVSNYESSAWASHQVIHAYAPWKSTHAVYTYAQYQSQFIFTFKKKSSIIPSSYHLLQLTSTHNYTVYARSEAALNSIASFASKMSSRSQIVASCIQWTLTLAFLDEAAKQNISTSS